MNTLIDSVGIGKQKLFVELNDGSIITIPKNYTKRLEKADEKSLLNYRLICNGIGIQFPDINEDISLEGILRDFK